MANICSICGKKEMLPYTCKFCGWTYCSEHRLPENHECQGLEKLKAETRNSGRIIYQPVPEPVKKHRTGFPGFSRRERSPFVVPISRNYSLYIIMICVAVYFLQMIFWRWFTNMFVLVPYDLLDRPWTIFSYMFLHGSFFHIFLNMLMLFFFGPVLERKIGSVRFLTVYFGAGLLSALGHILVSPQSPVLGASGAIYGVFACLALLDPEIRVVLFPIPYPIKIIYMLVFFALMDLLQIGSNDMIAHAAHLSGLLFGLYMGFKLKKQRSAFSW